MHRLPPEFRPTHVLRNTLSELSNQPRAVYTVDGPAEVDDEIRDLFAALDPGS
jgi:hypothetical protein